MLGDRGTDRALRRAANYGHTPVIVGAVVLAVVVVMTIVNQVWVCG